MRKPLAITGSIIAAGFVIACGTGSEDQSTKAEIMCEQFVERDLKSPASAEYTNTSTEMIDKSHYVVSGDVDSENSFGAMIRNSYRCEVTVDGDTWTLVDMTYDK